MLSTKTTYAAYLRSWDSSHPSLVRPNTSQKALFAVRVDQVEAAKRAVQTVDLKAVCFYLPIDLVDSVRLVL